MTSTELRIQFALRLAAQGEPVDLYEEEIYALLSEAQERITSELFERFEETRSLTTDLQGLVVRGRALTLSYGGEAAGSNYEERAALPGDFREVLALRAHVAYHPTAITTTTTNGVRSPSGTYATRKVPVRLVQTDDLDRLLQDPFSDTSREPVATIGEDYIQLYTGERAVPTHLYLDYLRSPLPISANQDPELPEKRHWQVIETALALYHTSLPSA